MMQKQNQVQNPLQNPKQTLESQQWLLTGLAFGLLFLIAIHKLTHASLWYDEAVEFYISKHFFANPVRGTANLYRSIVSTYQPPLYNLLIFIWLQFSEAEWWFRFFGVVMGVVGAAGVYKAIAKALNRRVASVAVLLLACNRQYIYYLQEAAEYTLLLASLGWLLYYWLYLVEQVTPKRLTAYLITATVAVYSQYGALFPVAAFSIAALLCVLYRGDQNATRQLLRGYGIVLIIAGLPLWLFFISKQLQGGCMLTAHTVILSGNLWQDSYQAVRKVMGWCFTYNTNGVMLLFIMPFLLSAFFSKKLWIKTLVLANGLCWLLYYFAVKLNYYTSRYDHCFASRYNLFFIPIWIVSFLIMLHETRLIIENFLAQRARHQFWSAIVKHQSLSLLTGLWLATALAYCYNGWDTIKSNWTKEDIRGATQAWLNQTGYNCPTLIHDWGWTRYGFTYYCEHDRRFNKNTYNKVIKLQANKTTTAEYQNYLNQLLGQPWPDRLYLISSTTTGWDTLVQCFTARGYQIKYLYNKNRGKLLYLLLPAAAQKE